MATDQQGGGDLWLGLLGVGIVLWIVLRGSSGQAATSSSQSGGSSTSGSPSSGSSSSGSSTSGSSAGSSAIPTVSRSASAASRRAALAQDKAVSLPGLSGAQVGLLQSYVRHYPTAITGVQANGVLVVNPSDPATVSLLAQLTPGKFPGATIPGVSGAEMGYLITLAKRGQLKGINANGTPVLNTTGSTTTATSACLSKDWSEGSSGPCVSYIQTLLNKSGALSVPVAVDGQYGPLTEFAVRVFQQDHGLTVDGIVGPQTWGALLHVVPAARGSSLVPTGVIT